MVIGDMKNRVCFFLLVMLLFSPVAAQAQNDSVYIIEIKQNIDKVSMRKLNMGIREAESLGVGFIVLDMNTYGGAVDAADSMRTAILQCPIPTVSFINVQAASAGALISIACDSIYMRSGSSIGAATVVNQNGEVMPDKYQSFMRGIMRSTAEAHGKVMIEENGVRKEIWHRDPLIARQMVDTANVLSFTPEEAIKNHYCEGMAESVEEVAGKLNVKNPVIVRQKLSWLDKFVLFMMSPVLQALFLMMIVGGIYFEFQSPGIGLPTIIAVLGAVFYFSPLYIYGLAMNWEILLFIVGIILLIVELFVTPGFGVLGISGIILSLTALIFAMVNNNILYFEGSLNLLPLIRPVAMVIISFTVGLIFSIWLASKLFPKRSFSFISQKTELKGSEGWVGVQTDRISQFTGSEVTAVTDMFISGKVEINGVQYEAIMEYGTALKGDRLKVVRNEGGRLYCINLSRQGE